MAKRIKSLSVSKISLLTSDHSPAVPKAGIGYSILKFFTGRKPEKIEKKELDDKLEKILEKLCKKPEDEKMKKSGALEVALEEQREERKKTDKHSAFDSILKKLGREANDIEKTESASKNTEA